MKLMSMVDFVLYYKDKCKDMVDYIDVIENYAEFLKQPLTLDMFVPINEKGKVLEEPNIKNHFLSKVAFRSSYTRASKEYQQAKERVLFEGFELEEVADEVIAIVLYDSYFFGAYDLSKSIFVGRRTNIIEGLIKNDLTLTQTAIKQLGL